MGFESFFQNRERWQICGRMLIEMIFFHENVFFAPELRVLF